MTINLSRGSAILLSGAVLAGVGTVLPWLTLTGLISVSRSGLELGGDSQVILVLAIAGGLMAGLEARWSYGLALTAGIAVILLALSDFGELQNRVQTTTGATISLGAGIWLCIAGAALMIVGAVLRFRERPSAEEEAPG